MPAANEPASVARMKRNNVPKKILIITEAGKSSTSKTCAAVNPKLLMAMTICEDFWWVSEIIIFSITHEITYKVDLIRKFFWKRIGFSDVT
jgi:hypothetical protein